MIVTADYEIKDSVGALPNDLIRKILQPDPDKRLTISEILAHPWMTSIPRSIEMFTEEEKEKIRTEFTFADCNKLNRNFVAREDREFTEFELGTTQNELLKNHSTKSVILAPFNSSATDMDASISDSIKKMVVE